MVADMLVVGFKDEEKSSYTRNLGVLLETVHDKHVT